MCCEIQWMERTGLEKEHRASVVCLGTQTGSGSRKFALPPQVPERKITARERLLRCREERSMRLSWKVRVRS